MRTTRGRVLSSALVSTVIAALLVVGPAAVAPTQASETPSNLGADFWIVMPSNYPTNSNSSVVLVSDTPVSAEVTFGALETKSVEVTSNAVATLAPTSPVVVDEPSGTFSGQAIHVKAGGPLSLLAKSSASSSSGTMTAIPTNLLGTTYRPMFYSNGDQSRAQYLARLTIVATAANTTVEMVPELSVPGMTVGETTTVVLQRGDIFNAVGGDPTGMLIASDSPIAVFVSMPCGVLPAWPSCDQMMSAIPPVSAWGSEFHIVRHQNSLVDTRAESIRVVAHESDTVVSVDGQVSATLAAGQSYVTTLFEGVSEASVITSTKPVMVAHFMNPGDYLLSEYDPYFGGPEMTIVTPTRQYLSSYLFGVPTGFAFNRLRMAVPTTAVTSLQLDGQPIATESATVIPGTDHSSLDVMVTSGRHVLSAAAPFGAYAYGASSESSYGFPTGFGLAAQPTPEPSPTDPPASDPSATESSAPDPSASEPPAADPPASDPTETPAPTPDPSESEPSPTDPPATEPPPTDPPATEPPVTDPPATDPPETDSPVTPPSDDEPLMDPPSESVTPEPQASTEPQPDPVATPTPTPTPTLTPASQSEVPAAGAAPPASVAAPAPVQPVPVPTASASSAATTVETPTALVSDTVTVGNSLESATANALSPASPTATPLPLAPTGISVSTSQVLTAVTMRQNVSGFAAARTTLTASQRRDVIAMARRIPVRSTVTCTGYSGTGPDKTALRLVGLARAQAVCAVVKKQRPGLITVLRYGGGRSASTAAEQARNRKVVVSVRQRA